MPRQRCSSPTRERRPSSALSCISEASMSSYEEGEIVFEKIVRRKRMNPPRPPSPISEASSSRSNSPIRPQKKKKRKSEERKSSSDEKRSKHRKRSKKEEFDSSDSDSSPDRITSKIEDKLKEYEHFLRKKRSAFTKYPKDHPLFETEWKDFAALMKKKNDFNISNEEFDEEWGKYWAKRLKVFDDELIRARKAELNRKYRIEDVDELIAKSKKLKKEPDVKPRYLAITTQNQLAGSSNDKKELANDKQVPESPDRFNEKLETKEEIKESKEPEKEAVIPAPPPPPKSPPPPPPPPPESTSESKEADSSPSLLQILRLLAALEDNLGSLGGTVTVVLSRVLSFERQQAGSSSSLAHEAVDLIDTCKEKLIGQIEVGLIEGARAKAAQSTIDKINRFLQTVEKPPQIPVIPIPVRAVPADMPPLIPVTQEELAGEQPFKPVADSSTSPDGNNNKKEALAQESVQEFSGEELKTLLENFSFLNETQKRDLVLYLRRLEGVDATSKTDDCSATESLPVVFSLTGLTVEDLKRFRVPVEQVFRERAVSECNSDASDVVFVGSQQKEEPRQSRDPRLNKPRPSRWGQMKRL